MNQINTISVGELIDLLKGYDENMQVAFSCNYGDRAHTQQVITIRGNINEEILYKSAYSDSGWAVDTNGYHEDEEGTASMLIIR